jgi:biotin transport system substrate-specific component
MQGSQVGQASLAGQELFYRAVWPVADRRVAWTRNTLIALVGSLLLWASAKVQIPFYPVPLTMQTYMVLVIGAACGWRLGGATVLLYLAEGAMGLPVFAGTPEKGIGLAYMVGPTGGYLVGFLASALLIGWLAERGWDRSLPRMLLVMTAGHLLILALGAGYLATLLGLETAWSAGVEPFLWATLLKTLLAGATLPLAWQALKRFDRSR